MQSTSSSARSDALFTVQKSYRAILVAPEVHRRCEPSPAVAVWSADDSKFPFFSNSFQPRGA
jgi:hypothetical protein